MQTPPSCILSDHNIASRTYATFPPVEEMRVDVFSTVVPALHVHNAQGVTIHDLQTHIADQWVYTLDTHGIK